MHLSEQDIEEVNVLTCVVKQDRSVFLILHLYYGKMKHM